MYYQMSAEFLPRGWEDPEPGREVQDEAQRRANGKGGPHPNDLPLLFDHRYVFREIFEGSRLLDLAKKHGWDPPQDTLTWKPIMQPFKIAQRVGYSDLILLLIS